MDILYVIFLLGSFQESSQPDFSVCFFSSCPFSSDKINRLSTNVRDEHV